MWKKNYSESTWLLILAEWWIYFNRCTSSWLWMPWETATDVWKKSIKTKQSSKLCMTFFWNGLAFWGQPIGSNSWDWVWQSWGRIWGNSDEEDDIPRILWGWSDILSQQYSKMSLLINWMTWTSTNQFEVTGWAVGTILIKMCFFIKQLLISLNYKAFKYTEKY